MLNNQEPSIPVLIQDLGAIYPSATSKVKAKYGIYKCECGNEFRSQQNGVLKGHTKSCGCYRKRSTSTSMTTHGLTKHRLYRIWVGIKHRTSNPKASTYHHYGARGISICQEWNADFMEFYNWSYANGYNDNLSIDRVDNNGNYTPLNCRWTDDNKQAQNTIILRKHNTTGFRGVSFIKKSQRYTAHIRIYKKLKHLGYFPTAIEAAKAYDNYIKEHSLSHTSNGLV